MYDVPGRKIWGPLKFQTKNTILKRVSNLAFGFDMLLNEINNMKLLQGDNRYIQMYECFYNYDKEEKFIYMIFELMHKDLEGD